MRTHGLFMMSLVLAAGGCRFNPTVGPRKVVACQSDKDCLAGQKCQTTLSPGLCVERSEFDGALPTIVGDLELRYEPLTDNPVAPSALGEKSRAWLRIRASESLAGISAAACPGLECSLDRVDDPAYEFICFVTDASAVNASTCDVAFTMVDRAGNRAGPLGPASLEVDVTSPTLPDVDATDDVVLSRRPWGTAAGGSAPSVSVYVRTVGADERLVVYDGEGSNRVLAVTEPGQTTAVVALPDLLSAAVSVVDRAANATARRAVRNVELVATMGSPAGAPANPHRMHASLLDSIATTSNELTPLSAVDGVASVDGRGPQTLGAGRWIERFSTLSPGAHWAAATYDEARGVGLSFGGCHCWPSRIEGPKTGMFEWNGEDWVFKQPLDPEGDGSPAPPVRGAMAFDGRAGASVLFGGFAAGQVTDSFWEWKGVSWRRLTPSTLPEARQGHAMAWEPRRRGVVLFGGEGRDGGLLADTWIWRDGRWSPLPVASHPSARADHRLTWDSDHHELVLTGGRSSSGLVWDAWRLKDSGWEDDVSLGSSLAPRTGHAFVYDRSRHQFTVLGGEGADGGALVELWNFADGGWTGSAPHLATLPLSQIGSLRDDARAHGTAFYDTARRTPLTLGGVPTPSSIVPLPDLAIIFRNALANAATYARPSSDGGFENAWLGLGTLFSPSARVNHAMTYDPAREVVVIHGGEYGPTTLDDTVDWTGKYFLPWTLDPAKPLPSPGGRTLHAMAYDGTRKGLILLGGTDEKGATAVETGVYRVVSVDAGTWFGTPDAGWVRLPIPTPPARLGHAMVWNPVRQRVTLAGGSTFVPGTIPLVLNGIILRHLDSWELGVTWERGPNLPYTAVGAGMTYDNYKDLEWILPGAAYDGFFSKYTTSFYSRASGPGPQSWGDLRPSFYPTYRETQSLVYDSEARRHLHYGASPVAGSSSGTLSSFLWEWNGAEWTATRVADEGYGTPGIRAGFRTAYDIKRGRTVLFGGTAPDVWEFDLASHRPRHVFDVNLDAAGVPEAAEVTSIAFASHAKGFAQSPLTDGGWEPAFGARLVPWLDSHWAESHSAVADDGGFKLALTLKDGDVTRALSGTGHVRVKIVPRGVNGTGNALVETDAIEATIRYRRP